MTAEASNSQETLPLARRYIACLVARQGRGAALAVVLLLTAGVLQGGGILLLLPLLESLDGQGQPRGDSTSRLAFRFFAAAGVPWTLTTVLALFLTVVALQALLVRCQTVLHARLHQTFTKSLRDRFYRSATSTEWAFFLGARQAEFAHVLTSDVQRISAGTMFLPRMLGGLMLASVQIACSLAISPTMTALTLAAMASLAPWLMRQNQLVRQAGEQATDFTRRLFSDAAEQLAGLKEAKCLGAVERQADDFERLTAEIQQTHLRFVGTSANTTLLGAIGSAIVVAGLLLTAVEWLRMPLAPLLVLVFLLARLLPRAQEIQSHWQHVVHMLPAFASLERLQQECDAAREPPAHDAPDEAWPLEHGVEFRGVCFRYANGGRSPPAPSAAAADAAPATLAVDLTIPARRTTAIVGPSGAGKSTMADLLLGLLTPDQGQILIDGRPLTGQRRAVWRRSIGYVCQETFLLHDTLRANLLWARPDAEENDLREALRLAAAEEFVAALPGGLDTVLGDRGVRLSGGQRQRIALARALLRRPALLVLDEATSALDGENQRRVQDAVRRLHGALTVVIIAHRLSTIRHADQIVFLESGRVVEQGTYLQLSSRPDSRLRSLVAGEECPGESPVS